MYYKKYIYPPRPSTKAPESSLESLGALGFFGQPKLNGSCSELYTDGKYVDFMTRHKKPFSNKLLITNDEFKTAHVGNGWIVLTGEYMNKSQKGTDKKIFNGKFVIWDILVYEGKHLKNTTALERQILLDELYPTVYYDGWIGQVSESIFRVNNIFHDFHEKWKEIIKIEMYEGLVFKKKTGKLELGFNANNNTGWQLKIRKPTANYSY